jgi:hypothetical protein
MSDARRLLPLICCALPLAACIGSSSAADSASMPAMTMGMSMSMHGMNMAADVVRKAVDGAYSIEVHVSPPQAFFTQAELATEHPMAGMLVVRGSTPLAPDAHPLPDHQLAVHVFDKDSGKLVPDATVALDYRPVDGTGKPTGKRVHVPVVVMQAVSGGADSTRYGNNVYMTPGHYDVGVTVNGSRATVKITI